MTSESKKEKLNKNELLANYQYLMDTIWAMADINRIFVESTPTAALYVLRGKVKLAQYEKASAALDFKKAEDMGYDKTTIDELMKMAR